MNEPRRDLPAFDRRTIAALMRGYLVFFLPWAFQLLHPGKPPLVMHWYLWAMCQAFQKAAIGLIRRLVINVPPRNLKSITAVAFTAWMLGCDPSVKIMLVTYGAKLSREHIENCRTLMNHPFYRLLYPTARLAPGGKGEMILRTTAGGGCRSVTVGGATTGLGADIIIIDDAMKAEDIVSEARREELERFFAGTLVTRLNNKSRGIIISIQQRLGEDDLPARLIEAGAEHLCLPAYDDKETVFDIGFGRRYRRPPGEVLRPDDESRFVLDGFRRLMGPRDFETQYLQRPSALGGNIIPTDAISRFDLEEFRRADYDHVVQSWDTATSEEPGADYSAGLTVGYRKGKWHLIDVTRVQVGYTRLRDLVLAQARRFEADKVLIERAGAGPHLWDDFRLKGTLRPLLIRPDADKVTRMVGQLALIEDGEFLIPRAAPWLDAFLAECRSFPGRHDDQVDALSQFLNWAKQHPNFGPTRYDPVSGRRLMPKRRSGPRYR